MLIKKTACNLYDYKPFYDFDCTLCPFQFWQDSIVKCFCRLLICLFNNMTIDIACCACTVMSESLWYFIQRYAVHDHHCGWCVSECVKVYRFQSIFQIEGTKPFAWSRRMQRLSCYTGEHLSWFYPFTAYVLTLIVLPFTIRLMGGKNSY